MAEQYFYGQGRVYVSPYGVNRYRFLGDVSALQLAMAVENIEHKESFSGQKSLARRITTDKTGTISMTLHQLDVDNLAMALYGTKVNTAAASGDATHVIPTGAAVGDVIALPHIRITDTPTTFNIEDDAGSPATLTRDTDYTIDFENGLITILNLGSYVFPLTATYRYGAQRSVAMFKTAQPELSLLYQGINLAEDNAAVRFEIYRVATDPLTELALINNEQALGGLPIEAGILIDTAKSAAGDLGQFGRFIEFTP